MKSWRRQEITYFSIHSNSCQANKCTLSKIRFTMHKYALENTVRFNYDIFPEGILLMELCACVFCTSYAVLNEQHLALNCHNYH